MLKRMVLRLGFEERLSDALEKASGCVECGECEARSPYHLLIRRLTKEESAFLAKLLKVRRG